MVFVNSAQKKRKAQFFLAGGAYSANYGYSFAKSCFKKKKSPPPALASQHTQHVIQLSVREMHFLLLLYMLRMHHCTCTLQVQCIWLPEM